jgi:hypothetical protein
MSSIVNAANSVNVNAILTMDLITNTGYHCVAALQTTLLHVRHELGTWRKQSQIVLAVTNELDDDTVAILCLGRGRRNGCPWTNRNDNISRQR